MHFYCHQYLIKQNVKATHISYITFCCSCASGDLTGKHGTIKIGSNTATRPTYTYVDNNVLLTSQFSGKISTYTLFHNLMHSINDLVLGNSVHISDASSNEDLGCATIVRTYISAGNSRVTVGRNSDELR